MPPIAQQPSIISGQTIGSQTLSKEILKKSKDFHDKYQTNPTEKFLTKIVTDRIKLLEQKITNNQSFWIRSVVAISNLSNRDTDRLEDIAKYYADYLKEFQELSAITNKTEPSKTKSYEEILEDLVKFKQNCDSLPFSEEEIRMTEETIEAKSEFAMWGTLMVVSLTMLFMTPSPIRNSLSEQLPPSQDNNIGTGPIVETSGQ